MFIVAVVVLFVVCCCCSSCDCCYCVFPHPTTQLDIHFPHPILVPLYKEKKYCAQHLKAPLFFFPSYFIYLFIYFYFIFYFF